MNRLGVAQHGPGSHQSASYSLLGDGECVGRFEMDEEEVTNVNDRQV